VVDDNATNRKVLDRQLFHLGMRPVCVESAQAARVLSVDASHWHERSQPIVIGKRSRDRLTERRILLAEDNLVNQKVARGTLEKLGCKVDIAANGAEAVAAWESGRYHLILMDCQMPIMDGYQATREIRAREGGRSRIPIVALTADAMNGAQEQCLKAGMDDYLTKPLDRDRLAESIDRHLARLRPAPRNQDPETPTKTPARAVRDAPADAPGNAPVDWEAFISLTDGDDDFAGQLVQLFIDSGDASLSEIRDALGRGDLPAVGRAAHAFKGSSANIRAHQASAAAACLEEAARAGAVDRLATLEEALQQEAGRVKAFLRSRRA
jgi:CheY-like chemotaxis protein/HPt (histidine-containing phosphotransfer) domain-containing protein